VASSPSKVLPGDVKVSEKEHLLARLSPLDEQQARLQERNELEMLRRQVEEKEAYIHDLKKSLSVSGSAHVKDSGTTTKSKKKGRVDKKGKQTVLSAPPVKQASSKGAGTSKEGMFLTIDALRKVPGLKKSAKKEFANLGLFSSEASDTDSSSTSDLSYSDSFLSHERVKIQGRKHKTKSGITSRSSDSV
jgi:hypothetical protein